MSLEKYRKQRKFAKTREPVGKVGKKKSGKKLIFVVHEHNASHLHWDLRLEDEGVLKSWAVTKKPPKGKGVKRLAIQVEDHPLAYAKFKGRIPEGNYGAGTVKIWDNGKYKLESTGSKKWVVELRGRKLKGRYVLVKTNYAKNSWLFFKV